VKIRQEDDREGGMTMQKSTNQWGKKRLIAILSATAFLALSTSCTRAPSPEAAVTPKGLALAGQKSACANGPRHRVFRIPAMKAPVKLGIGLTTEGWTFGGMMPGPVVEVCDGDTVTIIVPNEDTDPVYGTDHGLDSHAFIIDAARYNAVAPGKTLEFTGKMEVPGAFMYHCAVGPATDWHIKNGMYGAMIVYPRESLRDAREILVVQSAIYGEPDTSGKIIPTEDRAKANEPFFMMFNGQLEHEPIEVKAGQLVRVYFVNVGPGTSAVHVIGSILERSCISGNPQNVVYDVQTERVPPGGGAMFEFRPPKGQSVLVDHDNLRFLDYGFAIPFVGE
jgi:nitrite reductase (NO-forming)